MVLPAWLARFRAAVAALGAAALLWYLLLRVAAVDPIYWGVILAPTPLPQQLVLFAAAAAAAAWLAPAGSCRRSVWVLALSALFVALRPESPFAVLAAVAALAAAAGECAAILPESFWEKRCRFPKLSWRIADRIAFAGWIVAAVWSFLVQRHGFRSLYLLWQDWCQYGEHYLRIATGVAAPRDFFVAAGHWNPFTNCLMGAALWLWPAPETIFAVNAAALAAAGPLLYLLAKRKGFLPAPALLFGLCAWATPVFYNQSALFYGFHPVNLLVPLLLGFFLCRERRPVAAAVLAACSILVQETAAAFWCGYGLWLFLFPGEGGGRRRWSGAAVAAASVAYFLLISMAVMPKLLGVAGYSQNFHYEALGASPAAILLSPFLRPRAFWGVVSQWQNFAFLLGVLIPAGALALFPPRFAVAALPIAAAVLMQGSVEVKNLFQQYGLEITLILWIAAALNGAELLRADRRRRFRGALTAVAAATALMFHLYGVGCLIAPRSLLRRPDAEKVIGFLREKLPPPESGGRVLAPQRFRAHFAFERPVGSVNAPRDPGDAVLLDLDDIDCYDLAALRRELAADPRVVPVTHLNWYGRRLALYRVAGGAVPERLRGVPFLKMLPLQEPLPGLPFPARKPRGVELNLTPDRRLLFLRLREKPTANDLAVKVLTVFDDEHCETRNFLFANGILPAGCAEQGTVFVLEPGGKVLAAEVAAQ